jgi:hypothetical protein
MILSFLPKESLGIIAMTCVTFHSLAGEKRIVPIATKKFLKWLLKNRIPFSNQVSRKIIKERNLGLLKYLEKKSLNKEYLYSDEKLYEIAKKEKYLEIMQYLYQSRFKISNSYGIVQSHLYATRRQNSSYVKMDEMYG